MRTFTKTNYNHWKPLWNNMSIFRKLWFPRHLRKIYEDCQPNSLFFVSSLRIFSFPVWLSCKDCLIVGLLNSLVGHLKCLLSFFNTTKYRVVTNKFDMLANQTLFMPLSYCKRAEVWWMAYSVFVKINWEYLIACKFFYSTYNTQGAGQDSHVKKLF